RISKKIAFIFSLPQIVKMAIFDFLKDFFFEKAHGTNVNSPFPLDKYRLKFVQTIYVSCF
ncbi:MAG: hypothetical protein QME74_09305, partial [Candidatus Edwardsbacteria bacterium]|nr:hypothetical protein [Candidatus Edwardsbacteria bacterium]